jgi:hypothetical protein
MVASTRVSACGQVGVDGVEEARAHGVRSELAAEFYERSGVGHAGGDQIAAGEVPQRLAVVEGVIEGFGSQGIPLLEEMNPKNALRSGGRPRSPFG